MGARSSTAIEAELRAKKPIEIGVLHSLTGTMSISEISVKDATLLAVEEINASGGVLGCPLQVVIEDGASDLQTFAQKAKQLLQEYKVAVVFGCWTSASRAPTRLPPTSRCSRSTPRTWRSTRASSATA